MEESIIMEISKQQVLNDPEYKNFLLQKPTLSQASKDSYVVALKNFMEFTGEPFYKTIHELRSLQNDRIENNIIIRFNPNQSKINLLHYEFIDYLINNNCSSVTLNSYITRMRAIFNTLGIILPKFPDLNKVPKRWYVLTKEDIKYILDLCTLPYKAIINFAAVTGMRIADISNLKVKDFMKATEEYHNCTEVKDFLNCAEQGMMGFWELIPQKTRRSNVQCKVFNTPECSDLILFSLNERAKYYDKLREKKGLDYEITKNDPLFGNRTFNYKRQIKAKSISVTLGRYKNTLIAERERVFKYKYEQGDISKETYEESVATIPNFHAHGLRKFFITTLAQNRVDARMSALMEGHVPPIQTDSHYVNSAFLKDSIREEYMRCIPDLSFENVEIRFLTSEERRSLEEKIADLTEENKAMKHNMESYVDKAVEDRFKDAFDIWLGETAK